MERPSRSAPTYTLHARLPTQSRKTYGQQPDPKSLTPKHARTRLNQTELDNVVEYLADNHPLYLATVMDFKAQKGVFSPYCFKPSVMDNVCTISWLETVEVGFIKRLMSAVNLKARVERVLSTLGLVHSKL